MLGAGGATPASAAAYAYAGALIDELAHAGVRHACICPGSRSTPLALCLAEHDAISRWVHLDERSAAFFALGLARASGTPVALVCTSGTAAANFLPAIVEARYGRVPLLVLTADRPPELRDNGAPQAIDQIHLYGGNVKWFVEMPLPDVAELALRYVRATAARAAATAMEGPAGPVHLNLPFREPLTPPDHYVHREDTETRRRDGANMGSAGATSASHALMDVSAPPVVIGPRRAHASDVRTLAESLVADFMEPSRGRHGLIVCGPQDDAELPHAVTRLAALLAYPILADPLSGVRCAAHTRNRDLVCDAYDALLRALPAERGGAFTPDVVLRFGAIPTSKALLTFLSHARQQILVDGDGGWRDPAFGATTVVHADATALCEHLVAVLERDLRDARTLTWERNTAWLRRWHMADRCARAAIDRYVKRLEEPFEGKVFAELAVLLPDGATLYVGNSMPVRDLDTFFPATNHTVRFLANRGANGIDGVVSSALGASAARRGLAEPAAPVVLVIGDLSFYHDLNGLLAVRRYGLDATIVLLNNDGGGIFSFLPQATYPDHFEELFGTPTGLDFRPVAEMYGCGFERVEMWPDFRAAVATSLASPGVQVIELRTDRARNVELHRRVWAAVAEAVWRD